jgi:hypothetical protein
LPKDVRQLRLVGRRKDVVNTPRTVHANHVDFKRDRQSRAVFRIVFNGTRRPLFVVVVLSRRSQTQTWKAEAYK